MEYIFEVSDNDDFTKILIKGIWPSGQPTKIFNEIYAVWEKNGKKKILVDIRTIQDNPSITSDYFDAGASFASGFWQIPKIAVLDQIERKKSNSFFELTASNRGLRFRFFYIDEQKAIDWLMSKND